MRIRKRSEAPAPNRPVSQPMAPAPRPAAPHAPVTGDPRVTGDPPHDFGVTRGFDFGAMPWTASPAPAARVRASWWRRPQPPRFVAKPWFGGITNIFWGGGGLVSNNGSNFRRW